MSTKLIVALAAFGMFAAAAANAEGRQKILDSGDWAVYRTTDSVVREDGQYYLIPEACLAETRVTGGAVQVLLPNPQGNPQARGLTIVTIFSDQWQLSSHEGRLEIGDVFRFIWLDAEYEGTAISFVAPPEETVSVALQVMAEFVEGPIVILDDDGQQIASFSSRGMDAAIAKLNECGGLPSSI